MSINVRVQISSTRDAEEAYVQNNSAAMEESLSQALTAAINQQSSTPILSMALSLLQQAGAASEAPIAPKLGAAIGSTVGASPAPDDPLRFLLTQLAELTSTDAAAVVEKSEGTIRAAKERAATAEKEASAKLAQAGKAVARAAATLQVPALTLPGADKLVVPPPDEDCTKSNEWSLQSWLQGAGVHRVIAGAMQQALADRGLGPSDKQAAKAFAIGLPSRDALAKVLRTQPVVDGVVDLVWEAVRALQAAHEPSMLANREQKLAQALQMQFSTMCTYFSGLESIVGSVPKPDLLESMRAEHTPGQYGDESTRTIEIPNYKIQTCPEIEWAFVVEPEAGLAKLGLQSWPAEDPTKLKDPSHARKPMPLAALLEAGESRNAQLEALGQPRVIMEELIAARLYTGPMFIKYNSVLRGLTSNFPVFQKMAVELCCSTPVVCQFSRRVPDPCDPGAAAAYAAPFAEAARSMNRYTTAVHCINSAVLKLGQLAKVQPLYRGLHGFDVPKVFRTANEHGVRGGVEMGFMSTTPTRETAVSWAQGGGGFKEKDCSKVAMLFEIEQDIINRGANLAWLSEYPHEREILFGPFCALEVMSERWEGDTMLFSLRVHLNLLATPLEVVIQRRKQALLDSAVSKALQVQSELERRGIEAAEVAEAQRAVLEQISSYVEAQPAAHYNKDHNLAMAQTHIDEIVNVALSDEKLVSPPQQRAMAAALAESSAPVLGKPCELISGQPKSAAMGLYHFMRVRDPFAEEGTAKLEAEIVGFVARLKEHAARVKQHSVLVRLLDKAGPELAHLAEDLTGDASESIHEIEYFRAISWLPKGASPTEVVQVVENELHGNLKYILYDECSEVYVQGPNATRDKGRGKVRFGDFMASAEVKDAELTGSHVAALRLYTTLAYKYINAPLRSQNVYYNVHKPHPLPLTVAYIAEGIKKLRAAYAVKVTNQLVKPATALWRGMKNLKMAGEFMATGDNGKPNGGTELAPMSTSTDIAVAARYASSGDSLLFKISLDNFMQYGAEIKWLSAFPGEEEVLYPPLTYLQPTGKPPQVVQLPTGQKFTVYEVKPTLP